MLSFLSALFYAFSTVLPTVASRVSFYHKFYALSMFGENFVTVFFAVSPHFVLEFV